jgi:hypothetical protein
MSASINYVNPFSAITSLQPQHCHEITHSFAQRQSTISSILNSFRTLSVATGLVPPSLFPTHVRHAFPASAAIPLCFINLPPHCPFQKSQVLRNQADAASFAKHPGGGWLCHD